MKADSIIKQALILTLSDQSTLIKQFVLEPGHHRIGNDPRLEIPLIYPSVSKLHGALHIESLDQIFYSDLGSRNGSFLFSQNLETEIAPHQQISFHPLQALKIGPFTLRIQLRSHSMQDRGWQDVFLEKFESFSKQEEKERKYSDTLSFNSAILDRLRNWCQQGHLITLGATHQEVELALDDLTWELERDGPFTKLIDDDSCREIIANGPNKLYADMGQGLQALEKTFRSANTYRAWIQRLVAKCGRRLDLQNPICEGTLPNGGRLQAVIAPIASAGAAVAIRRFGGAPQTETAAVTTGWISPPALKILKRAILEHRNIIVSGGTSTGKTSLLRFLCQFIPVDQRLVTIEDTFELSLSGINVLSLQARRSNSEGVGEITLRQLVQCALRMRPDRILVGECRGSEVIDMLQAMNTGHPGSLTTLHANSAEDALQRLELLALMHTTNITTSALTRWIASTIHLVIQLERSSDGKRFVQKICEVHASTNGQERSFSLKTLYEKESVQPGSDS